MTKLELIRLLDAYPDDVQLLIESPSGGFEKPTFYVTSVRPRPASELKNPHDSEYLCARPNDASAGMLVFGSVLGCMFLPV